MGCLLIVVFFLFLGIKGLDPQFPWGIVVSPIVIIFFALVIDIVFNFKECKNK